MIRWRRGSIRQKRSGRIGFGNLREICLWMEHSLLNLGAQPICAQTSLIWFPSSPAPTSQKWLSLPALLTALWANHVRQRALIFPVVHSCMQENVDDGGWERSLLFRLHQQKKKRSCILLYKTLLFFFFSFFLVCLGNTYAHVIFPFLN